MINYNETALVQQNDEKIAKEAKELNQELERKKKKAKGSAGKRDAMDIEDSDSESINDERIRAYTH